MGDIPMDQEDTVSVKPLPIGSIRPGLRVVGTLRREDTPYGLGRQWTGEKWQELPIQTPPRPTLASSQRYPGRIACYPRMQMKKRGKGRNP